MERNKRSLLIDLGGGVLTSAIVFAFMRVGDNGSLVWIVPSLVLIFSTLLAWARYKKRSRAPSR